MRLCRLNKDCVLAPLHRGACVVSRRTDGPLGAPRCTRPPTGWTCSRVTGHPGPCAASPEPAMKPGWIDASRVCSEPEWYCSTCGVMVSESRTALHERWHQRVSWREGDDE